MIAACLKQLKPAFLLFFWLSLVTGLAYPLAVTGLGSLAFPFQAGGSLLPGQAGPAASALIGQPFSSAGYFFSRPSATTPHPYNAASSGGSNLGPSNPDLGRAVAERAEAFAAAHGPGQVPMDLLTASGSGLDPHISPEAAARQIARVAKERHLLWEEVAALVERHTQGRLFGFWGQPRVNAVTLNIALDGLAAKE